MTRSVSDRRQWSPLRNASSVRDRWAVGNARTLLQIKKAIRGTGQSTINVMVKEINKSKPL
jgi:hypothetical protein